MYSLLSIARTTNTNFSFKGLVLRPWESQTQKFGFMKRV